MGGALRKDISDRHKSNSKAMLQIYDPFVDSPTELASCIEMKVKDNVWKPNTARTYLNSFKMLLTFMGSMSLMSVPAYQTIDQARWAIIKDQSTRISTTLSALVVKDRSKKVEKATMINPDDLKLYLSSKRAEEAKCILQNPATPTRNSHTTVRNYLMMCIAVSNAHRTACISNLKVSDFKNATSHDSNYIIKVPVHKTAKTFGAAEVVVSAYLYSNIQVYFTKFRPQCECSELFVSWSGKGMESPLVINSFAVELGHAGIEKR